MQHSGRPLRQSTMAPLPLTADLATFYPIFAFYGGTLFVLEARLRCSWELRALRRPSSPSLRWRPLMEAGFGCADGRPALLDGSRAGDPVCNSTVCLTNINVRQDFVELVATRRFR